ncbi:hypothetical protein BIY29_07455 [Brenneria alni]|uniref:Uncharacterized protein n=1 Tax=Brenneria alni TaxID=71656 RepID=A0A421DQF2_9GAMM|nr:hypothetical protein [Brenneria alni]RLM25340.1 hypothetical protein BIY29_07455 [Brenneria alni]
MDRREEELHTLAEQVIGSLKQLPYDGQERQITISVGGNNPGSIHVGSVVNINHAPKRPPELHEMDDHTLQQIKRELISKRNESKRRSYFNIPSALFVGLALLAFGFVLWNIFLMYNGESHWLVLSENTLFLFLGWASLVMLAGKSMDKIRKIESRIINENQHTIDSIDVIFRRRDI